MKKIGLGLLLVLMPCFLWAEPKLIDGRWFKILDNPTWFVDIKTAKNGTLWVKEMIPKHKRKNNKAYYFLVHYDALCHENKLKVVEIVLFDEKNRVLSRAESESGYRVITPNTMQESLFEIACDML